MDSEYFKIDELPSSILPHIFKYVDITTLNTLRLCCVKFRTSVLEVVLTEILASEQLLSSKSRWFHTNEEINFEEAISFKLFLHLKQPFNLDQHLKRLHLNISRKFAFKFDFLEDFINFEQLTLEFRPEINLKIGDQTLDLPNLKTLQLIRLESCKGAYLTYHLQITAPQLTALSCLNESIDFLELADSTTVKHLQIDRYLDLVQSFVNLETLQCNSAHLFPSFDSKVLVIFKNLKKLELNFDYSTSYMYNIMAINLSYLREQKKVLNRSDLQIYANGVQLVDEIELSEKDEDEEHCSLNFQLENYSLLNGDLSYVKVMNYENYLRIVKTVFDQKFSDTEFPSDFFVKFFNIQRLEVNEPVRYPINIINISKSLKYLSELYLINSSIKKQSFYDQLPEICNLTKLKVVEFNLLHHQVKDIDLEINFDFILKFKLLGSFLTNQIISEQLPIEAIKKSKCLNALVFKFRQHKITIKKTGQFFEIATHPSLDLKASGLENFYGLPYVLLNYLELSEVLKKILRYLKANFRAKVTKKSVRTRKSLESGD